MLNDLFYIVWDFDPVMFSIGSFDIRYYGLTWALTILLGERFFSYFARREGFGPQIVETGFIWITLGAILGARIGHCLFYEFSYYITRPWAIITEIRNGGMASHGAAIGMLLGMWITARKCRMPYVWWLDRIMIPVSIGGAIVRLGNLCNSEIVGAATDLPWGFKFVRLYPSVPVDQIPVLHPAQLYEALCYVVTFAVLLWLYRKRDEGRRHAGLLFGVGLIGIFLTRFLIEFIKADQEAFEQGMALNMGQLLSIPFILAGVWMIWRSRRGAFPAAVPAAGKERMQHAAAAAAAAPAAGDATADSRSKKKKNKKKW